MPITPTYPGVYIEELPSGVRTIVGVATSITAFVGRALRGPTNQPTRIQSFGDYERVFGGLWIDSTMSYAVQQFFANGGTDAVIVRLAAADAVAATVDVNGLQLQAASRGEANPGDWGNTLQAIIDLDVADPTDPNMFNLTIQRHAGTTSTSDVIASEVFRNVSTQSSSSRYVDNVLDQQSQLALATAVPGAPIAGNGMFTGGLDGSPLQDTDYSGPGMQTAKTGIYALEDTDLFNLMCIPPRDRLNDIGTSVLSDALAYCQDRRAMLIVDPPSGWVDTAAAEAPATGIDQLRASLGGAAFGINAMVHFPRLRMPDQLQENRLEEFVPCGAVAGLIARTDTNRGVWKAPAGIEASLTGVREFSYRLTDQENGRLNPLGLNCLRTITPYGNIVWGARTLAGDDRIASEWKYIPVRRTALYIEESLFRGLHWVVFEPNDESLWAQIRLNVGAFMQNMFRQGAFQGDTPRKAYLVKCDAETNPQNLIDQGIVTVLVGFAPLKPAEFVIIQIQQLAGQLAV